MKVYEPVVATGYEWVNCVNGEDYECFTRFDGTMLGRTWKPILVRRVRADRSQDMLRSDFPWLASDALVMRKSAVDALQDILRNNGELLQLETEDDVDLYVFNAKVIDALDRVRSEIISYPGTDRILMLKRPIFSSSEIDGADLFRLPHRASSTYVSENFVRRVGEAGLKGLDFKLVWSSDQ